MKPSDDTLAPRQSSQITDADATTEPYRDLLAEALFRQPTFVQRPQSRETQAPTLDYHRENFESSTSQFVGSELEAKALRLFISAKEQIFEDGMESDFSLALAGFITSYGHLAMDVIISLVLSGQVNTEVFSEALRVVGRLRHKATHRDRLWLLERSLYSPSARVRDGATVGLSFLDDPIGADPLRFAIEREAIPELREDMKQVLTQLEGNNGGLPPKKDKEE